MPLLVYILISLLIILLVGGGYTFYIACVRRKELPWFEEEKLKETAYGKYYQYICYGANYLREHHAREISVTSTDGLRLSAAWLPIENAKGTIILAHGYRSCRLMEFSRVM